MLPFCWRPFILAGSKTISGASAYDFGSVLGRSTRLLYGSTFLVKSVDENTHKHVHVNLSSKNDSVLEVIISYFKHIPLLTDGGAGVIVKPAF